MLQRILLIFIGVMMLVVVIVAGALAWVWTRTPLPTPAAAQVMTDWLAVTADGQLQLHTNGQTRTLRTDAYADAPTLPVLSTDGTRIAYVRVSGNQRAVSVLTLSTGTIVDMYASSMQVVHMLRWAPDDQHVGFIVDTDMVMVAPSDGRTSAIDIARGAPAFLDWSPDSQHLLVRVGNLGRDGGMLGVYSVVDNQIHMTKTDVGDFQAARWDNQGTGYYYVVDDVSQTSPQMRIRYQKLDGSYSDIVNEGESTIRLLPAPNGAALAYIVSRQNERLLRVWQDNKITTIADNSPLTAWWSPDGRMLACLVVVDDTHVQWELIDAATGTRRTLSTFAPNAAMIDVLHYFDGTAYTPWSADGQWLMTITNDIVQAQAVAGGGVVPLGPGIYAQWAAPAVVTPQ